MIYDTFTFYNELEILKMRFEVLCNHVDYFVVVEANQTFTLKHSPKEMTFWENRMMFEEYLDKVIYIPLLKEFEEGNPWRNEYHQRNSIYRALVPYSKPWPNYIALELRKDGSYQDLSHGANDDDTIIMSDVDEIPDPEGVVYFDYSMGSNEVVTFRQKMFRYFLNCRCTHELWKGSRLIKFKHLVSEYEGSLEKVRHVDGTLVDGGWHYTGMGGVERFIKKMQSFSHADICDTPEYTDVQNMKQLFKERVLESGRDVHHFNNATYEISTDPSDFLPPQCDLDQYSNLIYDESKEF